MNNKKGVSLILWIIIFILIFLIGIGIYFVFSGEPDSGDEEDVEDLGKKSIFERGYGNISENDSEADKNISAPPSFPLSSLKGFFKNLKDLFLR